MKMFLIISIILFACFLLIKTYISYIPEMPISTAGGGGGAGAFFDTNNK